METTPPRPESIGAPAESGLASRGDGSGESEIGENRPADQVQRDVGLADVEQSQRVGVDDTDQPEEQQDDAHDAAEAPRVGDAAGGGEAGAADHAVDQDMGPLDREDAEGGARWEGG